MVPAGFQTELFLNAPAVLKVIDEGALPDIVITDINMPEMNGLEFIKALRVRRFYKPIIVISAYIDASTLLRATQLATFDFIEKPFEPERLLLSITRASYTNQISSLSTEIRAKYEELFVHTNELLRNFEIRLITTENIMIKNHSIPLSLKGRPEFVNLLFNSPRLESMICSLRDALGCLANDPDRLIKLMHDVSRRLNELDPRSSVQIGSSSTEKTSKN